MYMSAVREPSAAPCTGAAATRYGLRFARAATPPVHAFWSLTVYNGALALAANAIGRHALGSHSALVRERATGDVVITLSHAAPADRPLSNWLPVPDAECSLTLRIPAPHRAVLDGSYVPPAVTRVSWGARSVFFFRGRELRIVSAFFYRSRSKVPVKLCVVR